MKEVIILIAFLPLYFCTQFNGIVGSAVSAAFDDLRYAYTFSQPKTNLTFDSGSGSQVISGMATGKYDYGVSYEPVDISSLPDKTRFFPFGAVAFVTPINFPQFPTAINITFNRGTLARIFLGEISLWNDTEIVEANPHLNMPNQTILVVFRQSTSGSTGALTQAFTTFAPSDWPYGAVSIFPSNITKGNSRFLPCGSNIQMFSKIVDTPYSIGYTTLSTVAGQGAAIQIPRMVNKANQNVAASLDSLHAAMDTVTLDSRGTAEFIDSDALESWPICHFLYGIVSTDLGPSKCVTARELGLFFNWILNFETPFQRLIQDGAVPLSPQLKQQANDLWKEVVCNGAPLLETQALPLETSPVLKFLFALDLIVLVGILILTGVNFHYFSTPIINVGYTAIFSLGSLILFCAPPFFMVAPTLAVCQSRVWLTSLGFSIILGTMFSRTWQLREIYLLSRKKFDRLKGVSVTSSLVKLVISMSSIIIIVLIFLGSWSATDPYKPVLVQTDSLNLVGQVSCVSENFRSWMTGLACLIFILIAFGIYVIYQTWSFQRTALLTETKWVLFALYNVLINLVGVVPVMGLNQISQVGLATILCVTIIFSGTGIIMAVMLPRVINKLELSEDSSGGSGGKAGHSHTKDKDTLASNPHIASTPQFHAANRSGKSSGHASEDEDEHPIRPAKSLRAQGSQSRTPEAELVARLETPELRASRRTGTHNSGRESPAADSLVEMSTFKMSHESPLQPCLERPENESPGLSSSQHPILPPVNELSWSQNPLENREGEK